MTRGAPTDAAGTGRRLAAFLSTRPEERAGLSYALRVVVSALAAFLASRDLGISNASWAVVSAIVVILPGHRASVASAALRVTANVLGAGIGAGVGALHWSEAPSLLMGLLLVIALSRALAIDAAARSACVSLTIVLLRDPLSVLGSSRARVEQVLIGCTAAFLVTLAAALLERRPAAKETPPNATPADG